MEGQAAALRSGGLREACRRPLCTILNCEPAFPLKIMNCPFKSLSKISVLRNDDIFGFRNCSERIETELGGFSRCFLLYSSGALDPVSVFSTIQG